MKRALTEHSITYSALRDLLMETFLKSETAKSNAEEDTCTIIKQASFAMNTICQEGQYSELRKKHKDLLTTMENEDLQEKLEQFDTIMES